MAANNPGPVPAGGGVGGYFQQHPIMLIATLAAGVFVIVLIITRKNNTPVANTSLSGTTTLDANGNPVLYVPTTGDEWINIYKPVTITTTTTNNGETDLPPGHPTPAPIPKPPIPQPPPKQPPPPPGKPPSTKGQWVCHYTVRGGDTLSGIAARYNTSYMAIYGRNQATIDALAKSHGFPISPHPYDNIFPGETFLVPCTS